MSHYEFPLPPEPYETWKQAVQQGVICGDSNVAEMGYIIRECMQVMGDHFDTDPAYVKRYRDLFSSLADFGQFVDEIHAKHRQQLMAVAQN